MNIKPLLLFVVVSLALASKPEDWRKIREALPHESIKFWVGLHQQNVDAFQAKVLDLADPSSVNYSQWMSQTDIMDMIRPNKEHHAAVYGWLSRVEGMNIVDLGDAFEVTAKASAVGKLFQCTFYQFIHLPSGHVAIRQEGGATIPVEVADYIDIVTGLTGFPIIMPKKNRESVNKVDADGKYGYIVPEVIRRLYNIPTGEAATNPKNKQAVIEFSPVTAPVFSDVVEFCKQADEVYTNYSRIVGPFKQGGQNTEAVLDVEYLITIGSKARNEYWTIADGWAYEMALQLFNDNEPPLVASVSYGWPEVNTCQSSVTHAQCNGGTAAQYVARANVELSKLAGLGISVLVCTQDEGAPSEANLECQNKEHPVWGIYPGSSPWVTAVSATTVGPEPAASQLYTDVADPPLCSTRYPCAKASQEQPCSVNNTLYRWTTGGGFSPYGARESYQESAVQEWLKSTALKPSIYPSTKRGYADISGVGSRVMIWINGEAFPEAGTSASTPIVAGIITLLNDKRLDAGKKPLGFLNPLLYKMQAENPSAYQDITEGTNKCTSGGVCCKDGYGCSKGWDPPTGLGTPNYGEMAKYIANLP
mmetsp:Transcript_19646/g.21860  ORF Transcript_19646/g.21860 Transcript_19646/m.21860 type:complete len:590 (+) Transcript_19646:17-1786(+)